MDKVKSYNTGANVAKVNSSSVIKEGNMSNSCKASSYANVGKNSRISGEKNDGDIYPTMNITQEITNDFPLAILGCYKDFRAIAHTRSLCLSEGFLDVQFKYLGGLWVLFQFASQDAKDKFIKHKGILSKFSSLKPCWTPSFAEEVSVADDEDFMGKYEEEEVKIFEDNVRNFV
ncbi:hypothetical protein Tco_1489391 [Tanacetum coccineum]